MLGGAEPSGSRSPPLFLWPQACYLALLRAHGYLYMVRSMQESDEQGKVGVRFILAPRQVCGTWGYKMLSRGL